MLICFFVLKWKAFTYWERHNPPHIARTRRASAQAQLTASPRQIITNEWTLYMVAVIDPETVDGLGGLLGVVAPYRTSTRWFKLSAQNSLRVQYPRPFER